MTVDEAANPLDGVMRLLAELPPPVGESQAVDRLRALEDLKYAAAAAQAAHTRALELMRCEREAAVGIPASRRGRGLTAEIALARRESPQSGRRHLDLARALADMPHTFAALASGGLSERRAAVVARATEHLAGEQRAEVDRLVCSDATRLDGVGERALEAEVRRRAYEVDPEAMAARLSEAPKERRVTSSPAADGMIRISAVLPLVTGMSVVATLRQGADSAIAHGDGRTRRQVMADLLVERILGAPATETPVAVTLVVPQSTLIGGGDDPGEVLGFGPVPADTARAMSAQWGRTLRRIFTSPESGALVAMESRSRVFPDGLRQFVTARDRTCRIPYCDAPIEEIDHAQGVADGGPTTSCNAMGMCALHNRAKQNDGWEATVVDTGGDHSVDICTPTGHRYRTTAPRPPGEVA